MEGEGYCPSNGYARIQNIMHGALLTIYAPMIYTALCVMFLMRADTLQSPSKISTSAKEQNCPTTCNTETKHQQILRRKQSELKYPAETTARSRENSPPDVSVYQTSSDNK
jgi:hypothetical protein